MRTRPVSPRWRLLAAFVCCCPCPATAEEAADAGASVPPSLPPCEPGQGFQWEPTAIAYRNPYLVSVGGPGWFTDDSFTLRLVGGSTLVGYRTGTRPPAQQSAARPVGIHVSLPLARGPAVFSGNGVGLGCEVARRGTQLSLAMESTVLFLDARRGWTFEVRGKEGSWLLGPFAPGRRPRPATAPPPRPPRPSPTPR
jgi:hypothetical protein